MNRLLAFLLLIFLSPFLIGLGLIILVLQGRPLFYCQKRVGMDKTYFTIIKFRSMADGKSTFIGKIIRNLGLDELPQLINILKDEMNFLGPRPLTKEDVIRLEWDTPYYNQRWNVRPGLTGLAQLSPVCNRKYSWYLDKYYANHKSLLLDLSILTQSIVVVFIGKINLKKIKR